MGEVIQIEDFNNSGATIGQVTLARLQLGAVAFNSGNLNVTYHGRIDIGPGEATTAYIKDLDPRQLGNELLAYALCRIAGLPVPRAFLTLVEPTVLNVQHGPPGPEGSRLVFASEDANMPPLRRFYNTNFHVIFQALASKLVQSSHLGFLYGFDTWSANTDRNLGNVLVEGNDVRFIDHGACFTGTRWSPMSLSADKIYENKIKNWLTPLVVEEEKRAKIAQEAEGLAAPLKGVDFSQIASNSHANKFISDTDLKALIKFLEARWTHLSTLAADALDLKVA
ncbi:MAG: hypothetical protein IM662_13280 [Phenylobacterium sp.]|nr:hypothetical protein [Phenylobacterium sp.]